MIKHFAKRVEYEIPENLKRLVLAIIIGRSEKMVDIKIPIFATGFPLIVNIFGDKPTFTRDNKLYKTGSNLVVAGQFITAVLFLSKQGYLKM